HEEPMEGSLDVAGRSVVLLRELVPEEFGQRRSEQEIAEDQIPELAGATVVASQQQPEPEKIPELVETASTAGDPETAVDLPIPILAD
ncbi:MAG: hypothetical protein WBW69_14230, partial [Candidatus Korobacteraceae bacterium]